MYITDNKHKKKQNYYAKCNVMHHIGTSGTVLLLFFTMKYDYAKSFLPKTINYIFFFYIVAKPKYNYYSLILFTSAVALKSDILYFEASCVKFDVTNDVWCHWCQIVAAEISVALQTEIGACLKSY